MTTTRPGRAYHHGGLPEALVAAGLDLARTGGPDAIGVREVTRAVGVSPNAAYRHFADRDALVLAVAAAAQEQAAAAMRRRIEAAGPCAAIDRLRAIGLGYVDFALTESGLFQLAFRSHDRLVVSAPDGAGPAPFALLNAVLDELVEDGTMAPAARPDAEWACWAAVHGIADLATRGPLVGRPAEAVAHLVAVVVDRTVRGVTT